MDIDHEAIMQPNRSFTHWLIIALAMVGLLLVYVYQHIDYLALLSRLAGSEAPSKSLSFAVNRAVRLIVNDALCLVIIVWMFREPKFSRVAFMVFLLELLVLLPIYLVVKLQIEGPTEYSSPLLQPIHRMIVNPLLMFILITAFYYQQWRTRNTQ